MEENVSFSQALKEMKRGSAAYRKSWNGKGGLLPMRHRTASRRSTWVAPPITKDQRDL